MVFFSYFLSQKRNYLRKILLLSCFSVFWVISSSFASNSTQSLSKSTTQSRRSITEESIDLQLTNTCYNNIFLAEWWSYVWCHRTGVRQVHYNHQTQRVEVENNLGDYVAEESEVDHQIFRSIIPDCANPQTGVLQARYAEVSLECCEESGRKVVHIEAADNAGGAVIASVSEPVACSYYLIVCSRVMCQSETVASILKQKELENAAVDKEVHRKTLREIHLQRQVQAQRAHERALQDSKVMLHSGITDFSKDISTESSQDIQDAEGIRESENPDAALHHLDLKMLDDWESSSYYRASVERDIPTETDQLVLRERVRQMFQRSYDAYMTFGYPDSELRPLTCVGGPFELVKIPLVTLIDTLDTLVVMGNYTEFKRAVNLVFEHYKENKFNIDVNVSVFETTIRVLGGLLSAHQMAVDAQLSIYNEHANEKYNGGLLELAIDLGNRLLPAFKTNTGIPYGTVNLRNGVPHGETEIASTAGAGTLIVEFEVLSSLTQDRRYGDAAYAALVGIFNRRSNIGLVGKHIHIDTGAWAESVSGIGSNSDSFYEYLLKAYLLFRNKDLYVMFTATYSAIKRFVQLGDWFTEVDMFNGKLRRHRTENLHAFWPGMEATLGFSESGARTLNAFYSVWNDLGFLPEELDNVQWLQGKLSANVYYPLRPELIESTYLQYRTTQDRSWLVAGEVFLDSLEQKTLAANNCGYASIGNVETGALKDEMPSFFLSETLKYLYLLFDEHNFVHGRDYIFSTEAHLFDPNQLAPVSRSSSTSAIRSVNGTYNQAHVSPPSAHKADEPFRVTTEWQDHLYDDDGELVESGITSSNNNTSNKEPINPIPLLPLKCAKKVWWDVLDGYVLNSVVPAQPPSDGTISRSSGASRLKDIMNIETKKFNQYQRLKQSRSTTLIRTMSTESVATTPSVDTKPVESTVVTAVQPSPTSIWSMLSSAVLSFVAYFTGSEYISPLANPLISFEEGESKDENKDRKIGTEYKMYHSWNAEYTKQAEADIRKYHRMTRISNSLYNTARITEQLRARGHLTADPTPIKKLVASGDLQRRPNSCYPEDEPIMKGHQNALQTVEVSMGILGDFTVHVYADGFVVYSKKFGNTLEISNIGQPIMLIRDFNKTSSKTLLGDIAGDVIDCTVSVIFPKVTDSHLTGDRQQNHENTIPPDWERSCTIASFGPAHVAQPIVAKLSSKHYMPIVNKDSTDGSIPSEKTSNSAGIQQLDSLCGEKSHVGLLDSQAALLSWWEGLFGKDVKIVPPVSTTAGSEKESTLPSAAAAPETFTVKTSSTKTEQNSNSLVEEVYGRIAMARRGECMFEEKAELAYAAGAKALIVVNDDDGLFVMSGKNTVPGKTTDRDEPRMRYGTMPTIMLGNKDGKDLQQLLAAHAAAHNGAEAEVQVRVSSVPMLLNSQWMGDFSLPQIRMKRNVVHVVGRDWGAILSSATGQEWQLFIMPKNDMNASPLWPTTALTENNQQITTTAAMTTNPVELYRRSISRQCPGFLQHGRFGITESEEATQVAEPKPSATDEAVISALKSSPVTLKLKKKAYY